MSCSADGMTVSNGINRRSRRITWERYVAGEQIGYVALLVNVPETTGDRKQLGFMLYDQGTDTLEIVNFDSKLTMAFLGNGSSTKRNNPSTAGTHGVGGKDAAIVLLRNDCSVKMWSDGHSLNFGKYKKTQPGEDPAVYCNVCRTKSKPKLNTRALSAASGYRFESDLQEDVSVVVKGLPIEEFNKFLPIVLLLNPPASSIETRHGIIPGIIPTKYGDLILDPKHHGNLFTMDLYVRGGTTQGNGYCFGYNLVKMRIPPDRKFLSSRVEKPGTANILVEALQETGEATTSYVVETLLHGNECMDTLVLADHVHPGDTSRTCAQKIFDGLRSLYPGDFFYPESPSTNARAADASIITNDFGLTPRPLSKSLWCFLTKYTQLKEPKAEQHRRFQASPGVMIPQTMFAQTVIWSLRAFLSLRPRLKNVYIRAVEGAGAGIDLLIRKTQNRYEALVHQRCLSFDRVHARNPCSISLGLSRDESLVGDAQCFCDHVNLSLWSDAAKSALHEKLITEEDCRDLLRHVPVLSAQMVRDVKLHTTSSARELKVIWQTNESAGFVKLCGGSTIHEVVLHDAASCAPLTEALTPNIYAVKQQRETDCNCPRQMALQGANESTFPDLDPGKSYFAMVARSGDDVFWSLASQQDSPLAVAEPLQPSPKLEMSQSQFGASGSGQEPRDLGNPGPPNAPRSPNPNLNPVVLDSDSDEFENAASITPGGSDGEAAVHTAKQNTSASSRRERQQQTAAPRSVGTPRSARSTGSSGQAITMGNFAVARIAFGDEPERVIDRPRVAIHAGNQLVVSGRTMEERLDDALGEDRSRKRRRV